jgi:hypothetical protein
MSPVNAFPALISQIWGLIDFHNLTPDFRSTTYRFERQDLLSLIDSTLNLSRLQSAQRPLIIEFSRLSPWPFFFFTTKSLVRLFFSADCHLSQANSDCFPSDPPRGGGEPVSRDLFREVSRQVPGVIADSSARLKDIQTSVGLQPPPRR